MAKICTAKNPICTGRRAWVACESQVTRECDDSSRIECVRMWAGSYSNFIACQATYACFGWGVQWVSCALWIFQEYFTAQCNKERDFFFLEVEACKIISSILIKLTHERHLFCTPCPTHNHQNCSLEMLLLIPVLQSALVSMAPCSKLLKDSKTTTISQ